MVLCNKPYCDERAFSEESMLTKVFLIRCMPQSPGIVVARFSFN